MRKILILFVLLVSIHAYGKQWENIQSVTPSPARINLVSSTPASSIVHFSLDGFFLNDVITAKGQSFSVSLEGATPIFKKGAPDLPKLTTSLIIPNLAEMNIEIVSFQYKDYHNINIAPSKGNFTRDIDPSSVPYEYGQPYTINADFPGKLAGTREPFILRELRGQTLIAYPFQYNPVTKTLRVYYDMVLSLNQVSNNGTNPLVINSPKNKSNSEFRDIYARQFLNFNPAKYTPVAEEGSMLIISYGNFMPAMQPFVEWKISKGIPVEMVNVASIGNAQAIKNFIQSYYAEHDLAYVLLVGDHQQVPAFMSTSGASDNTYSYVAGTDHYSDLFVGRFSAENIEQVNTQVNKVLYYEINPTTTYNWFESCIGIGSSQGPGDDNEMDYEHIRNMQTLLNTYTYNTFYEHFDGSQGGIDAPGDPTPAQVAADINTGASAILYCGHGSQTSWGSSGFSNAEVNLLNNMGKLPFIISVACVNGDFTNATCFAEAWLRATQGSESTGAIATLMSTINQSWNPPMEGQDEMVTILTESYTDNIKRTFGGITMNGCAKMIDTYGSGGESMADTWVLFGDPSVVVRTALPQTITASHNQAIFLGLDQFQLTCPFDGALACVSMNNQILGTAVVNGGTVTVTFSGPLTTIDTIKLVITKYNHIPYIATIPIIAASGPFMAYQSNQLHDPLGNNNNLPDFGENILLDITLKNLGVEQANSVSAILSTTDSYVTITDNSANFGNIAANATSTQNNAFAFTVATNVPDQHLVLFNLALTSTSGGNWNSSFSLAMNAPLFLIGNMIINDAAGNANGSLDPGETVTLLIPTANSGHSNAPNTIGTLTTTNPFITINTAVFSFNTVNSGNTPNAEYTVTVDLAAPLGTSADFHYSVTSGAYSAENTFFRTVGLVNEDFETGGFTKYAWLFTGSNSPWTISTENPYEGLYCAKSGAIGNNQQSVLQVTMDVIAEDSISFYRKVSSEDSYDFLSFYIDGTKMEEWSGEKEWQRFAYAVTPGTHLFKWRYKKDYYETGGSDAAWVDFIVFPPVSLPMGITEPLVIQSQALCIFPNPATGFTTITYVLNHKGPVEITVTDAAGRLVSIIEKENEKASGPHSLYFDASTYESGLYLIRLKTGKDVITNKLILNR